MAFADATFATELRSVIERSTLDPEILDEVRPVEFEGSDEEWQEDLAGRQRDAER